MNKHIKGAENILFIENALRFVSINSRCVAWTVKIWIDKCSWEKEIPLFFSLSFIHSTYQFISSLNELKNCFITFLWCEYFKWHAWIAFSLFQLSDLFCVSHLHLRFFLFLFIYFSFFLLRCANSRTINRIL